MSKTDECEAIVSEFCSKLNIDPFAISSIHNQVTVNTTQNDLLSEYALEAINELLQELLVEKQRFGWTRDRIILELQNYVDRQVDTWLYLNFGISFDLINQLSGMTYEGSKAAGTLLIRGYGPKNADVQFLKQTIPFSESNIKAIRKYLVGCSDHYGLHIQNINDGDLMDAEEFDYVIAGYTKKEKWDQLIITIRGGFKWLFRIADGQQFYVNGTHVSLYREKLNDVLDKLTTKFRAIEGKKDTYRQFIEILSRQRHGTSVIFLKPNRNQKYRINKLIKHKKAICIDMPIDAFNPNNQTGDLLKEMSAIDGAFIVYIDTDKVFCFSAILDGASKVVGNLGRGARYNSIRNFLFTLKNSKNAMAIVFSEDGDIDPIDICGRKSKPQQLPPGIGV